MFEDISPLPYVVAMIEESRTLTDHSMMSATGTYAKSYVDDEDVSAVITADSVEAFVAGGATTTLLAQEGILRLVGVANELLAEAVADADKIGVAYFEGIKHGLVSLTELMDNSSEPLMAYAIQDVAVEAQFNGIVSQS